MDMEVVKSPHPATLEEDTLLKSCVVEFGRTTGPGGQNRNRRDTAATITHTPTGIMASASERRSQGQNRAQALFRLRLSLATKVRTWTHHDKHKCSELWNERRQGRGISINPHHREYPSVLSEALDVIVARRYDVAGAAGVLGLTMSQLAKLVRHDKRAFTLVNQGRVNQGLPRLK